MGLSAVVEFSLAKVTASWPHRAASSQKGCSSPSTLLHIELQPSAPLLEIKYTQYLSNVRQGPLRYNPNHHSSAWVPGECGGSFRRMLPLCGPCSLLFCSVLSWCLAKWPAAWMPAVRGSLGSPCAPSPIHHHAPCGSVPGPFDREVAEEREQETGLVSKGSRKESLVKSVR